MGVPAVALDPAGRRSSLTKDSTANIPVIRGDVVPIGPLWWAHLLMWGCVQVELASPPRLRMRRRSRWSHLSLIHI